MKKMGGTTVAGPVLIGRWEKVTAEQVRQRLLDAALF